MALTKAGVWLPPMVGRLDLGRGGQGDHIWPTAGQPPIAREARLDDGGGWLDSATTLIGQPVTLNFFFLI